MDTALRKRKMENGESKAKEQEKEHKYDRESFTNSVLRLLSTGTSSEEMFLRKYFVSKMTRNEDTEKLVFQGTTQEQEKGHNENMESTTISI